ncbi:PadR family transcriptional regulator [Nocardia goodfellowii]|uniref:DNA-binding PadR family transcriptional regulator n=1 Tax=Nocardia goodfellowii TaxID=882446 RepID=A0ABS4QHV3_9NOCA|nr:helix-turn-helix transcriptional regulator [Nocardia goodfellowii]MBP2190688.1 DNA-binding PadR family transcriptional regulator [Nocardia goodfellowii]
MVRDVRITLQTLQVLRVLLSRPADEHYGLKIAQESGLATGSIYPILARLETAGWVTSEFEKIDESREGRRRRRHYQLTDDGAARAQIEINKAQQQLAPSATPALAQQFIPRPGVV